MKTFVTRFHDNAEFAMRWTFERIGINILLLQNQYWRSAKKWTNPIVLSTVAEAALPQHRHVLLHWKGKASHTSRTWYLTKEQRLCLLPAGHILELLLGIVSRNSTESLNVTAYVISKHKLPILLLLYIFGTSFKISKNLEFHFQTSAVWNKLVTNSAPPSNSSNMC